MSTASPLRGGSDVTPQARADDSSAWLIALGVVMSMLSLAISIVAIVLVGMNDEEGPAGGGGGPVKTLAVELGDLYVKPDHVEVPSGTHLVVDVTDKGDLAHDLH